MRLGAVLMVLGALSWTEADEIAFSTVRMALREGGKDVEKPVELVFSDSREVVIRHNGQVLVRIPYAELTGVEHDVAKRHRLGTSPIDLSSSIAFGTAVILSRSTSHWLEFRYRHEGVDGVLVLHLDKHDYQRVISAAEASTGRAITLTTHS